MTPNANGTERRKAQIIDTYDRAQVRLVAARNKAEQARARMAAAGETAGLPASWPSAARSLTWPSPGEVRGLLEELREAETEVMAAREGMRSIGLHPENWV